MRKLTCYIISKIKHMQLASFPAQQAHFHRLRPEASSPRQSRGLSAAISDKMADFAPAAGDPGSRRRGRGLAEPLRRASPPSLSAEPLRRASPPSTKEPSSPASAARRTPPRPPGSTHASPAAYGPARPVPPCGCPGRARLRRPPGPAAVTGACGPGRPETRPGGWEREARGVLPVTRT